MRRLRPPTSSDRNAKLTGRLWVLAAALLWSTSGLFVKAPLWEGWPEAARGPLFAFWRAFFAAMVLMPSIRRPRWNGLLVPLVVLFALMNISYLTGMTRTSAANAVWLQATAPFWIFLASVILFRERIVGRDLISLAFGLAGVGLILGFEIRGQAQFGVMCGLASGLFYAGVLMCLKQLRHENAAWLIALNHAVAAVLLLPWVIHMNTWPSALQLVVLAGFGAIQMGIPYTFMMRGLRTISSQEAVAIGLVEPIVMPFWVFLAFGNMPAWWTLAGGSLILFGLVFRYIVWEIIVPEPNEPKEPNEPNEPRRPRSDSHASAKP